MSVLTLPLHALPSQRAPALKYTCALVSLSLGWPDRVLPARRTVPCHTQVRSRLEWESSDVGQTARIHMRFERVELSGPVDVSANINRHAQLVSTLGSLITRKIAIVPPTGLLLDFMCPKRPELPLFSSGAERTSELGTVVAGGGPDALLTVQLPNALLALSRARQRASGRGVPSPARMSPFGLASVEVPPRSRPPADLAHLDRLPSRSLSRALRGVAAATGAEEGDVEESGDAEEEGEEDEDEDEDEEAQLTSLVQARVTSWSCGVGEPGRPQRAPRKRIRCALRVVRSSLTHPCTALAVRLAQSSIWTRCTTHCSAAVSTCSPPSPAVPPAQRMARGSAPSQPSTSRCVCTPLAAPVTPCPCHHIDYPVSRPLPSSTPQTPHALPSLPDTMPGPHVQLASGLTGSPSPRRGASFAEWSSASFAESGVGSAQSSPRSPRSLSSASRAVDLPMRAKWPLDAAHSRLVHLGSADGMRGAVGAASAVSLHHAAPPTPSAGPATPLGATTGHALTLNSTSAHAPASGLLPYSRRKTHRRTNSEPISPALSRASPVLEAGWLWKYSKRHRAWRRRWMVVRSEGQLRWYKSDVEAASADLPPLRTTPASRPATAAAETPSCGKHASVSCAKSVSLRGAQLSPRAPLAGRQHVFLLEPRAKADEEAGHAGSVRSLLLACEDTHALGTWRAVLLAQGVVLQQGRRAAAMSDSEWRAIGEDSTMTIEASEGPPAAKVAVGGDSPAARSQGRAFEEGGDMEHGAARKSAERRALGRLTPRIAVVALSGRARKALSKPQAVAAGAGVSSPSGGGGGGGGGSGGRSMWRRRIGRWRAASSTAPPPMATTDAQTGSVQAAGRRRMTRVVTVEPPPATILPNKAALGGGASVGAGCGADGRARCAAQSAESAEMAGRPSARNGPRLRTIRSGVAANYEPSFPRGLELPMSSFQGLSVRASSDRLSLGAGVDRDQQGTCGDRRTGKRTCACGVKHARVRRLRPAWWRSPTHLTPLAPLSRATHALTC